ncbi:hypothetical protein RhiirA5_346021 [Rhizophagus irregularis]|uniref:Uncharacterized protein n=2 Tax=Rhizophagus irregularis TaxID=588596 RepID=A0A2I1E398_9GLOM|nr:hypothetical protein GLOIN_2v1537636 [Rhizophagus irregularis DAOM 181602=DAOM 197198]PKC17624.1 hypothetical protein RhiirA5_346021 [Rhizophagus irregularis]PKC65296.1 hypothetical protein RhiirA1_536438 [Rhizophagus irregularis]PKY16613.1 hypothetical protein RhiirB3_403095 [Rhizophagus irregularis]POG78516.1 hypothetical protein GLOIN_2v1537636 [Rhizophagus irregularis DAOM 181602=DAOM 197198]UZO15966.1 hypothetical protein OCT59_007372 [Rhizophagus irregularis]|eukprot:XP_025185382.1 hypothetical protein GLOIN_2v1537636 [Rhizophagus irregularis DAOM 181602=DAOM 197198]
MDVSIPINQPENKPKNWNKIIISLKSPKNIITLIVMLIICITGAALVLILLDWIKLGDTKKAFWVEIFSQILNGIFTALSLLSFHTRIIPFIIILQLLFKSKNNDYIKKQKSIKKYANWYNEQYDSLSFLLLVYVMWILNILSQASLTTLMWGFSSYDKNGIIVFSMITPKPRSIMLVFISLGIALSSSMFASGLIGYKLYKKNQLQKLKNSESSINI